MRKKHNVFINGRSVVTQASGGLALGMPNVCKTPVPGAPPVPVPYPSLGKSKVLTQSCATVLVGNSPVFTSKAKLKESTGDEPGSAGGVISGARGGEVTSTSHAMNVIIGGGFVVRDLDFTVQNKGNVAGVISQSQAPPPLITAADEKVSSTKECAFCEGKEHDVTLADPPGQHLRTRHSRSIANRIRRAWPAYGKKWAGHPWAIGKLQGHHLIDCFALKEKPCWARYCRQSGYDINHRRNGVMLPSVAAFACVLGVPQHLGNHDKGWIFDESHQQLDINEKPANFTPQVGKKRRHDQLPPIPLAYPTAVKRRISNVLDQAEDGKFCSSPSRFVDEMDAASRAILGKLANFFWTLRADGINLRPGGVGCQNDQPGSSCRKAAKLNDNSLHKPFAHVLRKKLQTGS